MSRFSFFLQSLFKFLIGHYWRRFFRGVLCWVTHLPLRLSFATYRNLSRILWLALILFLSLCFFKSCSYSSMHCLFLHFSLASRFLSSFRSCGGIGWSSMSSYPWIALISIEYYVIIWLYLSTCLSFIKSWSSCSLLPAASVFCCWPEAFLCDTMSGLATIVSYCYYSNSFIATSDWGSSMDNSSEGIISTFWEA